MQTKNLQTLRNNITPKFNKLWSLETAKENLWNKWINSYWTKNRDWWEEGKFNNSSWVLRRLGYCKKISASCIEYRDNKVKWIGKGAGFNVKDTYYSLREELPIVEWHNLVWNRLNSPRDALHTWLVARNRLLTKDRLSSMNIQVPVNCVLCNEELESRDHLFFKCSVAKIILYDSLRCLKISHPTHEWHLLIPWFNGLKQDRLKTKMTAVGISMAVAEIWRCRNNKIFKNEEPSVNAVIKKIQWSIKLKIGVCMGSKVHSSDRRWLEDLGIQ